MPSEAQWDADQYRFVFESSPVALWLEDFSGVRATLDRIHGEGVTDLTEVLEADSALLEEIIGSIHVVAANPAAVTLVGASDVADLLGPLPPEIISTDARVSLIAQIEAVWNRKDRVDIELEGSTFGGDQIDCMLHWSAPVVDGRRDLRRVVVAISDITARREKERRLEMLYAELEASFHDLNQFRTLTEVANDAIVTADGAGDIRLWNPAAAAMFGYTSEEAMRMNLDALVPDSFLAPHLEGLARRRDGTAPRSIGPIEVTAWRGDGSEFPIELTVGSWDSDLGPHHGAIIRDISERKARERRLAELHADLTASHTALEDKNRELGSTQAALLQAQRLESIGELAAGIAHEINTPIQYVGDNTRFVADAFDDVISLRSCANDLRSAAEAAGLDQAVAMFDERRAAADIEFLLGEVPVALQQTLDGVNRVAEIVRALKDFAHPGSDAPAPIDLTHAIESTLMVSRNEWKYVADITTDLDPKLTDVPALHGPLNQALLNIIVNAAHAVGDRVGTHPEEDRKGSIRIKTRAVDGWAEIRISDSGPGIPEAIRDRVFDPFFTTKDVGQGSGQGLAVAHNVVCDQHGGAITFETETGVGTTFIIRLPLRHTGEEAA